GADLFLHQARPGELEEQCPQHRHAAHAGGLSPGRHGPGPDPDVDQQRHRAGQGKLRPVPPWGQGGGRVMIVMLWITLTLLVPLLAGVPIAVALGGTGLIWLIALDPNYLRGVANAVWNGASNDVLTAVPLFILM